MTDVEKFMQLMDKMIDAEYGEGAAANMNLQEQSGGFSDGVEACLKALGKTPDDLIEACK